MAGEFSVENKLWPEVAEIVKKHSSEAFYSFDDPLEAAIIYMLIELTKEL